MLSYVKNAAEYSCLVSFEIFLLSVAQDTIFVNRKGLGVWVWMAVVQHWYELDLDVHWQFIMLNALEALHVK